MARPGAQLLGKVGGDHQLICWSATAAAMCDRWVSAWGKYPSSAPVAGSNSSANSPKSLAVADALAKAARACAVRPWRVRSRLGDLPVQQAVHRAAKAGSLSRSQAQTRPGGCRPRPVGSCTASIAQLPCQAASWGSAARSGSLVAAAAVLLGAGSRKDAAAASATMAAPAISALA